MDTTHKRRPTLCNMDICQISLSTAIILFTVPEHMGYTDTYLWNQPGSDFYHASHCVIICIEERIVMRTTLDLPSSLVEEAMELTHIKTKTELIKTALRNMVQQEKIHELKDYFGKVNLDINLDVLRDR